MRLNATAEVSEIREGIADELASLTTPLMTRLAKIDELIASRLEDLKELREVRIEIVRAVRPLVGESAIPLEPGRNAKPGPPSKTRRKPGTKKGNQAVAESRVDDALAWLRESRNGNTFSVKDVQAHIGLSEASASAICRRLVEREQIRFDGTGPVGLRLYRLVA